MADATSGLGCIEATTVRNLTLVGEIGLRNEGRDNIVVAVGTAVVVGGGGGSGEEGRHFCYGGGGGWFGNYEENVLDFYCQL